MRNVIGLVALLSLIVLSNVAFAAPSYTTYMHTGDGVAVGEPCYITKIRTLVITAEVNDYTVVVYDNATAATGKVLATYIVDVSEENSNLKAEMFQDLSARNGVYIDVTSAGTVYWWVEYRRRR